MALFLAPLTALIITLLATPLAIKIAKKLGLVDDPTTRPHPAHVHKSVIPRAGGISIYLGLVLTTLLFIPLDKHIVGLIISLTILLFVGLLDDKLKNFSPYKRIAFQFLAAAVVVASGVGITFVTNPFGGIIRLDSISIPITLLGQHTILLIPDLFALIWFVTVMNVINWSKGVDGQMPGIILIASAAIGLIALRFFLQGDQNQYFLATLAFITAASSLGFLIFNWHPAKIFPGFSGSTILGFMVAYLSILSSAKIAAAVLVLLIPFVDAFYTAARRILSGRSPVWADKQHLHHKLLALGWSHQKIALFYIFTAAFFATASILLPSESKFLFLSFFSLLMFALLIILHIIISKEDK